MARPEGSSNKNKAFLLKRLQDMYGEDFHPIMNMAKNCVVLQKIADEHSGGEITAGDDGLIDATNSAKNANEAWDKIAQYVEPKLKAIEIEGEVDQTLTIIRKEYKPSK